MQLSARFLLLFLFFQLTSCASVERRIEQNQAAFNQLPPETQERVRNGEIRIGDSPEAVRIAKGHPDRISLRHTEESRVTIWRWFRTTSSSDYLYPPAGRRHTDFHDPIFNITYLQSEEILRVDFLNGKVSVVEEVQDE